MLAVGDIWSHLGMMDGTRGEGMAQIGMGQRLRSWPSAGHSGDRIWVGVETGRGFRRRGSHCRKN